MDTKIIDDLYDIYKSNTYITFIEKYCKAAIYKPESKGGGRVLIENLNEYINSTVSRISNMYSSKNEDKIHNTQIHDISVVFDKIAYITEMYIDYINNSENSNYNTDEEEKYDNYSYNHSIDEDEFNILPQDLFKFNLYTVNNAYKKYKNEINNLVTPEVFEKVINLIKFVREKRSLQKIYPNTDLSTLNIEEILNSLYDYHKNKNELFDITVEYDIYDKMNMSFANYYDVIKLNCNEINDIDFKNYRAKLISNKGINTDIDKLTFMRNLLEYYRTGIFVDPDASLNFFIDEYEYLNIVDKFKKIYNRNFDNREFVNHQGNFIFDINKSVLTPKCVKATKKVLNGKSLAMGVLLGAEFESNLQLHLLHIFIKDITNPNSTYEIQFNALPSGNIENRVQLIRFDNWEEKQTHKNIGQKLDTTSHIHIYNHLDLLRGAKNGAYDIAYNISDESIDFDRALKIFIDLIISNDSNFAKELTTNLLKTINKLKAQKSTESSSENQS